MGLTDHGPTSTTYRGPFEMVWVEVLKDDT
jgi:hypothetical protein